MEINARHAYNLDVEPFLTAVETATSFYKERHIDIIKDGISLPGLTLRHMFSNISNGDYFTIINRTDADLHWLFKEYIMGGPAIIFHRYHEKYVTFLRQHTNNQDSLLCKKILGYDANALYLSVIMQELPAKHCIRYKEEDNCKPHPCQKYGFLA